MSEYIPPRPPLSIYNDESYFHDINSKELTFMNSNFLNLNGGTVIGASKMLSTLTLGNGTGTTILSSVPLNVPNYCNTTVALMASQGTPYVPSATSYYITSSGSIAPLATSASYSFSGFFATDVGANAFISFSDRRIKTNIIKMPESLVDDFITRCEPKLYNLKSNPGNDDFGYIAQDLYKNGFANIVQLVEDKSMKEEIDDDGFINPDGIKFTIAYTKIIPILHQKIKSHSIEIEDLKAQLKTTLRVSQMMEREIKKLQNSIQSE